MLSSLYMPSLGPTVRQAFLMVVSLSWTANDLFGATLFVNANSATPLAPYTSWATAADSIQQAVDAATAGDEIVVTNGIYQAGGRVVVGALTNRVALTKPLRVRSVNGPSVTTILGHRVPVTGLGDGAVRCVYLTNGAELAGFTLTNGATRVDGDIDREQSGGGIWCESTGGVISNCVISGCAAYFFGGGAYRGTFNDCTFSGNSAGNGGGAWNADLHNCTITASIAYTDGGGASGGTLNNCVLTDNSASYDGGGVAGGTLNNCTLVRNSAFSDGGAVARSTLSNCALVGNSANFLGGGATESVLVHCTVTGNTANHDGGGTYGGALTNCIVYHNSAARSAANHLLGSFHHCCTTPRPASGLGNLTNDPSLATPFHLSATSACQGAAAPGFATGSDIDGESWLNPPSIGCDEYRVGSLGGSLSLAIRASFTNVAAGFLVEFTADINGRATASRWDFGDGTVSSNQPYARHQWTTPGDYAVSLTAFNESFPSGVSTTLTVRIQTATHYVWPASPAPSAPYDTWATAAPTIQDAVNAAQLPGALILVTNGLYAAGGQVIFGALSNRVAVTRPVTVCSVNGPAVTTIQGVRVPDTTNGDTAMRCVYLTNQAQLIGFTLTNGATRLDGDFEREQSGGSIWCASISAMISNCVLIGNSALAGGAYQGTFNYCNLSRNSSGYGGGAYHAALNHCTLDGNTASLYGGGAFAGVLNNCVVLSNTASSYGGGAYESVLNNSTVCGNSAELLGGGTFRSTANNCIAYFNTAGLGDPNYHDSRVNYCCTLPLPFTGNGNFTNSPAFVDYPGGNLRLRSDSPCINSGLNNSASGNFDRDGLARIAGGTVDVGAYELQAPPTTISIAWLLRYGLPIDGSADTTDPDSDRLNNWQEWRCGTDPNNAQSVLRLLTPAPVGADLILGWESVAERTYFLERRPALGASTPFQRLATGIAGNPGVTTYTNRNAAGAGPDFYRVGVD
jgi:PKD repeat protein